MARDISEVVKELQSALEDVQAKHKVALDAHKAADTAAREHRAAQDKAAELKMELETIFNSFVPVDTSGRVRVS